MPSPRTSHYWIALSLACILLNSNGLGQPPQDDPNWSYRFDLFQLLLQQSGLEPKPFFPDAYDNPEDSVIVLIGQIMRNSSWRWTDMRDFVNRGGRIIYAPDNYQTSLYIGTIQAGPVTSSDAQFQFQNHADCLRLTAIAKDHLLTTGLTEIVINRSGWLEQLGVQGPWQSLIFLPDKVRPVKASGRAVAAVCEVPNSNGGAMFALADPSVFSNGMILFGDNGKLAHRLANWFGAGRKTMVMIVDMEPQKTVVLKGQTQNSPASPPQIQTEPIEPPQPKLETLLDVANDALREVADPNRINDRLKNQPRRFKPHLYAWSIWVLAAMLGFGVVAYQLAKRVPLFVTYFRSQLPITGQGLWRQSLALDVSNRIASESIAREFSRRWSGKESQAEWRQCLDELRHSRRDSLSLEDRVKVESILAVAVFGGRTPMTNIELQELGRDAHNLLAKYRRT